MKLTALGLVFVPALAAQDIRLDSAKSLAQVVVVAERSATPINRSTSAVTRITAEEIARLPHATVADVLRQVPGFAVVEFDGLGRDQQLMARGFYGGGEAEYVVVLVDGRAVNRTHNGTIAWDALPPLANIEAIEIVRGSASAAHGDAAVGGVINIVTRSSTTATSRWMLGGGSHGTGTGAVDLTGFFADRPVAISIGVDRTSGFRDHAERGVARARGTLALSDSWRVIGHFSKRNFDEPGPLLEGMANNDRSQSDPMFRLDRTIDQDLGVALEHRRAFGQRGTLHSAFATGQREMSIIRTLPLAPGFGDTQERGLRIASGVASIQADIQGTSHRDDRLTVGASVDIGKVASRYRSTSDELPRLAGPWGDGSRTTMALFALVASNPTPWLRWTMGLHADIQRDAFGLPEASLNYHATRTSISPKAGLNVRYAGTAASSGHLYLTVSNSFKAPTLDQLYDQRSIPVPFPPFAITPSNPDLEPQRGTNVEAGLYHDIVGQAVRLTATVAVYQIAMREEIDFDVPTFSYRNIARSRHRGLEAGLTVRGHAASAFLTVGLQDVITRAGVFAGSRLKAIPGQTLSAGVTLTPHHGGTVSVSLTRLADMFLDDANTRRLDDWTRIDAQVAHTLGAVELVVGARNLLDATYHSTGYLDASGSGAAYYYPAAGRVVTLGVRHGW